MSHRQVPLLNHPGSCAVMGCDGDHSLADQVGIDIVECSECHQKIPVDQTVRFFKDGRNRGRACRPCAGFKDYNSTLAEKIGQLNARREAGQITQEYYDSAVAELL